MKRTDFENIHPGDREIMKEQIKELLDKPQDYELTDEDLAQIDVSICGQKADHEHIYESGKSVFSLTSGGYVEDTPENRQKYYDTHQTDGHSVVCDICGRPAMEDMWRM